MNEPVVAPRPSSEIERSLPSDSDGRKPERLVSLDAFRGLTMLLMVLVNNAGSGAIYHQLPAALEMEWLDHY